MLEQILETWEIQNRIIFYLRGQIIIALKQSGHPVGKKIGFGMWEWGVR